MYIIHQSRRQLKSCQTSETSISAKIAKEFQSSTIFAKIPSQKFDRIPNTCYKVVVRKSPCVQVKPKEH